MLAYILALAIGIGSLGIYLAAFFLPEIHRKSDFYWSGLGLFYALVLWVCAGRITGGVLLGQVASVALIGWFSWQTLTLRRQLVPPYQQTELPNPEVAAQKVRAQAASVKDNVRSKISNVSMPAGVSQLPQKIGGVLTGVKDKIQGTLSAATKPKAKKTPQSTYSPQDVVPPISTTELDSDWESSAVETSAPKANPILSEVEISQAPTAIENFPKEVKLTPPAEPTVSGNLADRVTVVTNPPTTSTFEATAKSPASSPFEEIASSQSEEVPALKRPTPPDPKLVEEAVEDAQAKNLPASPPERD